MQALRTPVFCAPFTTEDLEIMEYHEELKYWRSHGYGPLYEELYEKDTVYEQLSRNSERVGQDVQQES